ncbi:hypothetical protein [Chamaesiphon sp.]
MIGEFNSDRQEVWYLETSTLTVAVHVGVNQIVLEQVFHNLDTICQTDA